MSTSDLNSNFSDTVETYAPPSKRTASKLEYPDSHQAYNSRNYYNREYNTTPASHIEHRGSYGASLENDKYRTPEVPQKTLDDESTLSQSELSQSAAEFNTSVSYNTTDHEMTMSMSSDGEAGNRAKKISDLYQMLEDGDYHKTKQTFAYLSIIISSVQLLVMALQLSLCGVAPLDVNPFVGSYPDALSEWGGKNPTLLKQGQWWRVITSAFLNVGVLQLMVNAAVQLETCAYFEREWGSTQYFWIYFISAISSQIVCCSADPDTVGVGSSAAIMGLFGAKLAQVFTQVCFEFSKSEDDTIRVEQLGSVMCSIVAVMALSFFTYIDWSGHMGGMATGFTVGIITFGRPIRNRLSRTLWRLLGIILLFSGLPSAIYVFIEYVEPDPDLANTCDYYRNLYAEGYDCSCFVL
jgi:rhomboid protease GluP